MQASDLLFEHLPVAARRLRVAMVTETFPPEINGVAMTIGRIVAALQARDHQVQLIRPRQRGDAAGASADGHLEQVLRPGIPIPHYQGLHMGLPAKRLLARLWTMRRPDVVHIATEGPLGWSAMAAARKLGIPVLSGFHTNFHSYSRHYGLGWLKKPIHAYLRKFHNQARLTVVPTRGLRDELTGQGYRNIEVLARGVDGALFTPERRDPDLRRHWGVGDAGLAVLYVGRLAPEKNLELLVRAFEAVEAVRPDARLVLVGDGPEAATLKAAHPRFVHAGAHTGTDLARHYASADLFLFPSLTETFGNVVLEAMASGLAVLGFDYAAAAEHIRHGENGLKPAFGDEVAFLAEARRLAGAPALLGDLREEARAAALAASWNGIYERLEGYYLRLVREGEIGQEAALRRLGVDGA
ncbi:glycosyltransferase family 1 protein [Parasulfuritortus cantonensis]|uniref:Glycosyltransferase family 1 protein n=1 Tax=Parasulfuritortus cantonensis TaxID=2528202 RepID=A0A4R1BLA9_9PROT|nr:glycosyltransferase family 1 protein [Parasulfuritortus cantonensis]TCJ18215.1 glycosyltransferase family 1 protein [Parasulfuritortus cantonensis]